mgnify:CR=1 FL=1
MPILQHKLHDAYLSVLAHARGRVVGSFKQKYSHRVAHSAYAEYLEKLQDRVGRVRCDVGWIELCTLEYA